MFHWRVSKYDPAHRDAEGAFRGGTWTAASDIGQMIGGMVVTVDDYLAVEHAYLTTVREFMAEAGLDTLTIDELEPGAGDQDSLARLGLSPVALDVTSLGAGTPIAADRVDALCTLALREVLWCKLSGAEGFYVHFGYDYYLYIGSSAPTPDAIAKARALGLIVERKRSPYAT